MHHLNTDQAYQEKAWRQLHKNATIYIKQIPAAASDKTAAVRLPTTYLENHPN